MKFIISVKWENLDGKFTEEIILDRFDNKDEAKGWVRWLAEVYRRVNNVPKKK